MKISINKSAKRGLSLVLAFAMLIGCLFTANVGVTIIAGAETAPIEEGTIDLLEFGDYLVNDLGSTSEWYDTKLADNGETGADWDNAIIIDSAEELVYLCKASGNDTIGKYYKVADGIAGFNLATDKLDVNGTLTGASLADGKTNLDIVKGSGKNHSGGTPGFQGHFDGNGATVYGAWTNHESITAYAGLFSCTKGEVTIKNINVNKAHFTGKNAVGGIIGYHAADSMCTVTVENCSVTDSYFELTGTGWGTAIGGVIGWAHSAPSYKETETTGDVNGNGTIGDTIYVNVAYNVKNCFVNLDEANFVSGAEGDEASSTIRTCHGGVVGGAGSNAVMVSDCIVLGITPYSTSVYTGNDVQHTGGSSHFKNVYTDQATGQIQINYNTGWAYYIQDFSSVVFQLTPAQMQGSAAVGNMNLAWFSGWIPGEDGEYPTINQTGEESSVSFWTGAAASEFAGGDGTKENPFIIKTADQLYRALSTITDATNNVAGGKQTSQILKQDSTTEYVPVYTPYYYKVDDSIEALYLGNVYGKETKEGIHAAATANKLTEWKPGKSFVGYLDGNGVTIYGMYSKSGEGLVYKLDGSATVKNINFDACYTIRSILTNNLGSYANDSTLINVSNISVRNSCLHKSANTFIENNASYPYGGSLISTGNTCEKLTITNCLFDARSCDISNGQLIHADKKGTADTSDDVYTTLVTDTATVNEMVGGIISGGSSMNNVTIDGCVSLGAPIVDEVYYPGATYKVNYTRYSSGFEVFFYNSYTDVDSEIAAAYPGEFDKLLDIERLDAKDAYATYDMPKLSWGQWSLVTDGGRTIPMPVVNTSDKIVGSYVNVIGKDHDLSASVGPYENGSNPFTYKLKGSGTEADPFLIENDAQLARAIATGGMNLYDRLYYKLVADIDLSGGLWINQVKVDTAAARYTYTPFGGSLDGNGHVITGLSAGDSKAAGLIPVLASGGEVKNLHVRDANIVSSTAAGVIVGDQQADSTITGCSAENCTTAMPNDGWHIMGNVAGAFNTLYFITADGKYLYVDENGTLYGDYTGGMADLSTMTLTAGVWYKGGKEGSMPRLANLNSHANDLDIVGDGKADGYGAGDLSALKNKLLKKSAYNYINGDVSRNGIINIADLAILQRTMADAYGYTITDSFFSNVEAGEIKIYYGENDNYDAARKVELYLESLFPGVDVQKCVSTTKGTVTGANSDASKVYLHAGDKAENPDGKLDVIIGDVVGYAAESSMADNTYEVTYDSANKFVWLKGKNFTAVEQAAINFTNGCAVDGDVVYTCGATVLSDEKKPVTVMLDTNFDGTPDTNKTLYYAWGDEFEEDTINTYNWTHNTQQTEGSNGSDGSYNNLEIAPVKDLGKVITVTNGRLSMKRGHDSSLGGDVSYNDVVGSVALDVTPGEFNGYRQDGVNAIDTDGSDKYFSSGKIVTDRGMLYKQGYIEFQGQLPADGHAFPAWWLMGRPSQSQTNHGYDNSLYGKVYKLNQNWDGVSDAWDESNLDTFKYQIPSAIYEIDMIEVMQHSDRHWSFTGDSEWGISLGGSYHPSHLNVYKNSTTAVNMYFLNTTIHKWWNNGVDTQDTADTSDDRLWIADWDNYQAVGEITNSAFKTTSSAGSWIHNIGSTKYDFGSPTKKYLGNKYYYDTSSFNQTAHDNLTQTRRYGFSWNTDGTGFEATLYIYNADGTLKGTVPIASGMSDYAAFKDGDKKTEANGAIGSNAGIYSDAKVFNQYMYILFDNKYYSANENNVTNGSARQFTDLLTCAGLKSFEIDYVRVYQEDGFRDIVTQETQAFNNNNHFGYN